MAGEYKVWCGAAALVALVGLGGCGTLSSITGASSESAPPSAARSSGGSWRDVFIFGAATPPPIVRPDDNNRVITCPSVAILDGASAYRVARPDGSNTGVSHQASVSQIARECRLTGNTLEMRVGVEGLLLLGPGGKPGTFTVPVRVVVKRGENLVFSRISRETVTVPSNDTQASFTHIEEGISLPLSAQDPGEEYDILVGFDPGDGQKAPKRTRRHR